MSEMMTGRPQLNRFVNRRLILERIRRVGEISRAELAEVTEIRPPTVSAVVKELIEEGLVEEVGNGQSRGGRAPRIVSLSSKQLRAIGFEVSETHIKAGVANLRGELTETTRIEFLPNTPEKTVDRLHALGEELIQRCGFDWSMVNGVGIALPGHLDPKNGVVRWSKPLEWKDVPFKRMCELRWGTPTDVVNDSAAGSLASHFFGESFNCKNLIYMYLRFNVVEAHSTDKVHGVVGMGSGIIINGEPFHGEFGAAGEITTLVAHPLVDARDAEGRVFQDVEAFVEALRRGESSAEAAMDRVAQDMSHLVVHAVNFLEPGAFILGSDNSALRDALLVRLERILDDHRLQHEAGKTAVVASKLGEFGVVQGAVVPVLQRVFRMPRWT